MLLHLFFEILAVDVSSGEVVPIKALIFLVKLAQFEVLQSEVANLVVIFQGVHVDV